MFDLEDSENVKLSNNKTSGETLLRGRNLINVAAEGNEAGTPNSPVASPQASSWWANMSAGLVAGILCAIVVAIGTVVWAFFFKN